MSTTDFVWLVLLIVGCFAAGVLAGVALERSAAHADVMAQIRTTEPPPGVGDLRRTRAPFGVSPHGRPWNDEVD